MTYGKELSDFVERKTGRRLTNDEFAAAVEHDATQEILRSRISTALKAIGVIMASIPVVLLFIFNSVLDITLINYTVILLGLPGIILFRSADRLTDKESPVKFSPLPKPKEAEKE